MENSQSKENILNVENISQRVREAEYAVRGELVTIAGQMERDIEEGKRTD